MTAPADGTSPPPDGWPACRADQHRVALLGTYHMANPGLDATNVEADDVLAPARQRELEALVDRLADWSPDLVAVEHPAAGADGLNDLYERYRSGELAFDAERAGADTSGAGNVPARDEVVQVGFRLAAALDHDRVLPIDDHVDVTERVPADAVDGLDPGDLWVPDEAVRERYSLADLDERTDGRQRRLRESTVAGYLRWLNAEEQLRENHRGMFAGAVPVGGEGGPPLGPVALGAWYERNVRIVHHLWRGLGPDDERALTVVGSGHVRVLRHLLGETPMLCPVSPRPLLAD